MHEESAPEKSLNRSTETDGDSPLVLIADDEEPIAEALASIVEDSGYSTRITPDGRQALAAIRERHPALVITDLMMPLMTGAELIAAIRADATTSGQASPPIVLMSAADKRYTSPVAADAYLAKPFDILEVEELLARFLGQNKSG